MCVAFHPILLRAMVDNQVSAAEVVKRWRRSCRPLQRGSLPGIVRCLCSPKATPKQIEEEDELGRADDESRYADETVQGNQRHKIIIGESGIAANIPYETHIMHGHKDAIHTDESQPEVPLAQRFVHHSTEHFREPEIGAGKNSKHGCKRHYEMEVGHDKIGGVQVCIKRRLREKEAAETAGDKHGDEPNAE